jgi:serine/threonine protein phosphatase PrpC
MRAPARDAVGLAQVLADPEIGGFTVTTVIDRPAHQVRLAIEDFLHGRGTQDLLLVYLSCHGQLDARRRLYFAASDTRLDRLGSTGVESAWVLDQLEHCRARRQVLILDCCFSGAFAGGAKGEADLGLPDRFLGQGRGRVVLTASTATEYSFEGEPADAGVPAGSVFTAALVHGLRTGAADLDHDGHVSVDDAYAYVFDQVQAAGAAQTPQRWLYGAEGRIWLARSPAGPVITPAPLPESLRAGLDSPHPGIRIGAVTVLGEWLASGDPALAASARRHLQEVAVTDIPRVAQTARTLLGTQAEEGAAESSAAEAVVHLAPTGYQEGHCPVCGEDDPSLHSTITDDGYCEMCGRKVPSGRDHSELDLGLLAGVTDRGLRHPRNDDAMALATVAAPGSPAAIAVVCDGVSTSPRPDEASLAAAKAAAQSLATSAGRGDDPVEASVTAVRSAHQALARLGAPPQVPSTTYISAVTDSDMITICWLGNCRAYWLAAGSSAERLTRDDSLAEEMVAQGTLAGPDALASPQAHVITRWLGADPPEPHLTQFRPPGPGALLICTDGLWKYQPEADGLARLALPAALTDPLAAAAMLAKFALDAGGMDNITVVLAPFTPAWSRPASHRR